MTDEFKKWWLWYVEKNTPEDHFHLPLEPKSIDDLTPEEFDLYIDNECELKIDTQYGIEFFLCKKKS